MHGSPVLFRYIQILTCIKPGRSSQEIASIAIDVVRDRWSWLKTNNKRRSSNELAFLCVRTTVNMACEQRGYGGAAGGDMLVIP